MSIYSVSPRSFILALFIRDDNERFLLGDNGFDFKDSQLHFAANSIENDEVAKQGADGVMLAGQVRRSNVQKFEGYIGDGATPKETIESMRRDFIAFFAKGHHFRVVYVDCNKNAWQRKGGYLVDAPEVQELWQIHPEYSVGLNFEDVNYYSYDENSDGEEILSNIVDVPVSVDVDGGLVWDEDGAESETATVEWDTESTDVSGKNININSAIMAPLESVQIDGETSQNGTPTPSAPVAVQTTTGENVIKICGKNLLDINSNLKSSSNGLTFTANNDGSFTLSGTTTATWANITNNFDIDAPAGAYTFSISSTLTHNIYLHVVFQDGASSDWTISRGYTSVSRTISNGIKTIRLDVSGMTNGQLYNETIKVQLEKSATASQFEPYQGQSYTISLGKNLYDKNDNQILSAYIDSDHSVITENSYNRIVWIKCEPNTTYTVSRITPPYWGRSVAWTEEEPGIGVQTYGYVQSNNKEIIITTGSTAQYLVYKCYQGNNDAQLTLDTVLDSIKIQSEPIELVHYFTYQDYIHRSGGKWYKHATMGKQIVNTNDITLVSNYTNAEYGAFPKMSDAATYNTYTHYGGYCTHGLIKGDPQGGWNQASNIGAVYDTPVNVRWWVGFAKGTGLDAIKTALEGCILYYPLATPVDIEITDQALIEQLDTIAEKALIYQGTNNIFTITPNEVPTLEIGYYTKYEFNITDGGYVWEQGGQGGPTTVINESISNVSPVWTVHGPVQNPILENTTTGEQIEYVGTIAEGQTLVVDMGEQTAELNGLNVLANITGDFVSLAPGRNVLLYVVDDDGDPSQLGWSEIVG